MTRGQMAAFLARAFDIPPPPHWKFIDSRDHLFQEEIDAIGQAGIAKGCNPPDNFLFCPDDPVTRAQMAAFLHRALPDLEIIDATDRRLRGRSA